MTAIQSNNHLQQFFNGTLSSIQSVVPFHFTPSEPKLLNETLQIKYGVLIGFAGDIRGKIAFKGERTTFQKIGEKMFGMPLEEPMLSSFTGEFGNMIAGGLSVHMSNVGTVFDITPPTVMEGDVSLSGFENAVYVNLTFEELDELDVFLLVDKKSLETA